MDSINKGGLGYSWPSVQLDYEVNDHMTMMQTSQSRTPKTSFQINRDHFTLLADKSHELTFISSLRLWKEAREVLRSDEVVQDGRSS